MGRERDVTYLLSTHSGWSVLPDMKASLAQSVERETLNLKVAGSTPAWGFIFLRLKSFAEMPKFYLPRLFQDVAFFWRSHMET
jgi:hypothetical protein